MRRLAAAKRLTKRRRRFPPLLDHYGAYRSFFDAIRAWGVQPAADEVSWARGEVKIDHEATKLKKRMVKAIVRELGPDHDDLSSAYDEANRWASGEITLAEGEEFQESRCVMAVVGLVIPLLRRYAAGVHGSKTYREGRPKQVRDSAQAIARRRDAEAWLDLRLVLEGAADADMRAAIVEDLQRKGVEVTSDTIDQYAADQAARPARGRPRKRTSWTKPQPA